MLKNKIYQLLIGLVLTSSFMRAAEQPVKTSFEEVIFQEKYFKKELDDIKKINPDLYDDIITQLTNLPTDPQGNISYTIVKNIIQDAFKQLKIERTPQPALEQNRMTPREFFAVNNKINTLNLTIIKKNNPVLYKQVQQDIKATTDAQGKIDATAAQQIIEKALQISISDIKEGRYFQKELKSLSQKPELYITVFRELKSEGKNDLINMIVAQRIIYKAFQQAQQPSISTSTITAAQPPASQPQQAINKEKRNQKILDGLHGISFTFHEGQLEYFSLNSNLMEKIDDITNIFNTEVSNDDLIPMTSDTFLYQFLPAKNKSITEDREHIAILLNTLIADGLINNPQFVRYFVEQKNKILKELIIKINKAIQEKRYILFSQTLTFILKLYYENKWATLLQNDSFRSNIINWLENPDLAIREREIFIVLAQELFDKKVPGATQSLIDDMRKQKQFHGTKEEFTLDMVIKFMSDLINKTNEAIQRKRYDQFNDVLEHIISVGKTNKWTTLLQNESFKLNIVNWLKNPNLVIRSSKQKNDFIAFAQELFNKKVTGATQSLINNLQQLPIKQIAPPTQQAQQPSISTSTITAAQPPASQPQQAINKEKRNLAIYDIVSSAAADLTYYAVYSPNNVNIEESRKSLLYENIKNIFNTEVSNDDLIPMTLNTFLHQFFPADKYISWNVILLTLILDDLITKRLINNPQFVHYFSEQKKKFLPEYISQINQAIQEKNYDNFNHNFYLIICLGIINKWNTLLQNDLFKSSIINWLNNPNLKLTSKYEQACVIALAQELIDKGISGANQSLINKLKQLPIFEVIIRPENI